MFGRRAALAHASRARAAPGLTPTTSVSLGNQARLRRFAQGASAPSIATAPRSASGLVIGAKHDPLEREADRVADAVMGAGPFLAPQAPAATAPLVSRKCAACDEQEGEAQRQVQAAPAEDGLVDEGALAPASVDQVLGSPGRPLEAGERGFFEPRFGRDFGRVRLHDDAAAGASAREVGAFAYAVGEHVVVDPGRYSAGSDSGRRLLAHELAHVVQQGGADAARVAGDDAKADAPQAALTPSVRRLQRYSHSGCSDSDLKTKVWPGDGIAKQMVDKAIRVLSATPIDPAVTPLLTRFFMTATPNIATILDVYKSIKAIFTANNYTYECNDDCDDCAYVRARMRYIGLNPNIHLCMNTIGAGSATCFGYLMVHEFSHYAAHTGDPAYCHSGCCTPTSCPTSLSASDALDNADSYGAFANDLFPMSV